MQKSHWQRLIGFLRSALYWDRAFLRNVVFVALPMVVQELMGASLHIIDGLMVSGMGDAAYSAVTQANRFTFLFQLFVFGTASGSAIYLSQYWGVKDVRRMRGVMGLALTAATVLTAVFSAAALLFPRQIISCFLPAGESFELAVRYLVIVVPSYLLTAYSNVYAVAMKAAEKTYIPMIAGMAGILTNTVLNYAMIYGHFGFPAMGVDGAAIATVVSGVVSLLVNLCFAYGKRLPAGASLRELFGFERSFVPKYLKTVTPVIFNEGLWALGTTMYGAFYGRMGDISVAAMGICSNIDNLVWVFIFGMMNATAIIVGKTLGVGDKDRAYLYAKRMMAGGVAAGLVLGLVLIVIRAPLVNCFTGLSYAAREKAMGILFIGGCSMWFRAFNCINVVGVLRSGGDTMYSLLLDVGSMWTIGVPLAALAALVFHWPIEAVYLCTFSEEFIKMLLGIPHFKQKKWMRVLTKEEPSLENA